MIRIAKSSGRRVIGGVVIGLLLALVFAGARGAVTSPDGRESSADSAGKAETDPRALTVVAEVALERGNCLAAADGYSRAAALSPDVSLARRATEVSVACEQWPIALKAAERWRTLAPNDAGATRSVGLVALKLYRIPQARTAFAALLGLSGKDAAQTLVELVPAAEQTGGAHGALAALGDLAGAANDSAAALVVTGALAYEADHLALARDFAGRATKVDPKSAESQALLARVKVGEDDADGALASARRAIELSPAAQRFLVAEVLTDLDRFDEARAELERLAQTPEVAAEAERRLALLAFRRGDLEQARNRFSEIYGKRESSTESLYYLSVIAELSGDEDAALSGYEQLAQSDAGSLARLRAAALIMRSGDRERAFGVLDDVGAERTRSMVDSIIEKASLLSRFGAPPDAVKLLDIAMGRYPGHPQLAYERATALERAGRVRDAVKAFDELLAERPDDPMIQNALGYTLADHKMDLSRAETLIRRALEVSPDSAAILDSLGWVRYRRGDTATALSWLEKAYRLGRDPEIAAHWGEVLWSRGSQAEARAVWAKALAHSPQSDALKAVIERFAPQPKAE